MTSAAEGSGELPIGATFAGYRIEALIGRGGMGAVYRVRDVSLDHERALKILDGRLAADSAFRERFQRESRMMAAIEHPAIATVHRAGEEDGRLFIAMRLVRGPDLRRLVEKDGPLEPRRTARIVRAVAGALDAAHRRGIVHRDVKPANILVELDEEGEHAYLTDFGIGRPAGGTSDPITSTGELIGTADYISPEQIEGRPAGPAADVYALGCVVFHLLTGESPFARETSLATLFAHANAARPRPSVARSRAGAGDRRARRPGDGDRSRRAPRLGRRARRRADGRRRRFERRRARAGSRRSRLRRSRRRGSFPRRRSDDAWAKPLAAGVARAGARGGRRRRGRRR